MDYIERDKVKKLLSNIKFPFEYSEDFYTFFLLDTNSRNIVIFYAQNFKTFTNKINYNKIVPLNLNNKKVSLKIIFNNIKKNLHLVKKNYLIMNKYDEYSNQFS